jgi:hypothetical protein
MWVKEGLHYVQTIPQKISVVKCVEVEDLGLGMQRAELEYYTGMNAGA